MSLISGYLNQIAQIKTEAAAVFYDGPAAASLEPLLITGIGGDAFRVKVQKSGGGDLGGAYDHVTVYGTLEGTPDEETLSYYYGSQTKTTTSYFDTITAITTDMAGEDPLPNIRAVAVDAGGVEIVAEIWENFDCRWERKNVSYWNDLGNLTLSDAKVMCEEEIEAGDIIRLASEGGLGEEVKKVKPATGLGGAEEFRTLLL